MNLQFVNFPRLLRCASVLVLISTVTAVAQPAITHSRQFPPGSVGRVEDLPPGRFRTQLENLSPTARGRALGWLREFHFTELDLDSLHADPEGGIFYADTFSLAPVGPTNTAPVTAEAAVPVNPFPAGLIFHSRPGSPNVLYLNFSGATVTGTAWNTSLNRSSISAVAFSTDSDYSTFSDAEQVAIKRIWERVSEDYAPFDIDVTTERPATFTTRTAHALITRSTDANNNNNPSSTAGGISYINVFGSSSYSNYRPGWIYFNNLANLESYIAEAVSHEMGHNFGLSHDGKTDGTAYYGGHGSGNTSWGPIMGTGYDRNVSQWSKGEYYLANNTEDDLAIIAGKISFRSDDRGNTIATATPLVMTSGTNIVSTTPETDPENTNKANKGVLESNTDIDVYSFMTGSGPVNISVKPWIMPAGTRGGNLDVRLQLYNSSGTLILTNNPATDTIAQIQTNLPTGLYYLSILNTGTGTPLSSSPSGYTSYGSIGQYFISGTVQSAQPAPPANLHLTATVNSAALGIVSPTNGSYAAGSPVQITATPASYSRFVGWTNDVTGTNNPLTLVINTNVSVEALFAELITSNYSTPYSWLASWGYTNNFESVVSTHGSNGIPLWQSYIAGLNPTDPNSQLRLSVATDATGTNYVLNWNTVTGRVYTLSKATNFTGNFATLYQASNLPASVQSFTNRVNTTPEGYYRVEVRKL
jgi:hypothetical protein